MKKQEIFTQSEITTMDNCGKLWDLRYKEKLSPKIDYAPALYFGDLMHSGLSAFYGGTPCVPYKPDTNAMDTEQELEVEYYFELHKIMLDLYRAYYKLDKTANKIHANEDVLVASHNGVKLKGKIDLFATSAKNNKSYVWDHKTCSSFDRYILEGFEFRFQFMFYVWLAKKQGWKVSGYCYNAIRKPALRRQKGEGLAGFLARCKMDMHEKPESYFLRQFIDVSPRQIKRFEEAILAPKTKRISLMQENPEILDLYRNSHNTDYCFKYNRSCEFLPICKDGFQAHRLEFKVRKEKHTEL